MSKKPVFDKTTDAINDRGVVNPEVLAGGSPTIDLSQDRDACDGDSPNSVYYARMEADSIARANRQHTDQSK